MLRELITIVLNSSVTYYSNSSNQHYKMANMNNSGIEAKIEERSTYLPWYQLTVPSTKLDGAIRELLEDYAGFPSSEVEPHVYNIVSTPSLL